MLLLQRFTVALAMMAAVPGLAEIAEDALHLALEGHSLHADAHDAGAEGDSSEDHGCSDCSHCVVCHCHASPVLPAEVAELEGAFEAPTSACPNDDETPDEGFSLALERPPRA